MWKPAAFYFSRHIRHDGVLEIAGIINGFFAYDSIIKEIICPYTIIFQLHEQLPKGSSV